MRKMVKSEGITERERIMLKNLESDSWKSLKNLDKIEKSEERLE